MATDLQKHTLHPPRHLGLHLIGWALLLMSCLLLVFNTKAHWEHFFYKVGSVECFSENAQRRNKSWGSWKDKVKAWQHDQQFYEREIFLSSVMCGKSNVGAALWQSWRSEMSVSIIVQSADWVTDYTVIIRPEDIRLRQGRKRIIIYMIK